MNFSDRVIEAMGFKELTPSENIKGIFHRIDVFMVKGLTLESQYLPLLEDTIDGARFKIGIGGGLNEACKLLVGEDFVEDEESWLKQNNATPPFLLIVSGPSDEFVGSGSYINEGDDLIVTYDSFGEAKDWLKTQAEAVIPTLITAMSISFSSQTRDVRFIPIAEVVAGSSTNGKTIQDIRLKMSGELSISIRLAPGEVIERANKSIGLAKSLDAKVAKFFYLGLNERDPLKRFIYFFIFVEQSIHTAYSKIDHKSAIDTLLVGHNHVNGYAKKLFGDHRDTWKDLRSRLTWCVMHKWQHMSDLDIQKFESAKAIRDSITHGKLSSPDPVAVGSIEKLAIRILQTAQIT